MDWEVSSSWWLLCSAPHHWAALAGCTALRRLRELHASQPPPAGLSFPHVTRLDLIVGTSPGDTVTVLGAFPALEELRLKLAPAPAAEVGGACSCSPLYAPSVCTLPVLWVIGLSQVWYVEQHLQQR